MRKYSDLKETKNGTELTVAYDTDPALKEIYEEKKESGKGFTKGHLGFGGNMRKVASIPFEEITRLGLEGDQDALDALNFNDQSALRRLIRKHPEWRTSEGMV
jgi:hypothetical protein